MTHEPLCEGASDTSELPLRGSEYLLPSLCSQNESRPSPGGLAPSVPPPEARNWFCQLSGPQCPRGKFLYLHGGPGAGRSVEGCFPLRRRPDGPD